MTDWAANPGYFRIVTDNENRSSTTVVGTTRRERPLLGLGAPEVNNPQPASDTDETLHVYNLAKGSMQGNRVGDPTRKTFQNRKQAVEDGKHTSDPPSKLYVTFHEYAEMRHSISPPDFPDDPELAHHKLAAQAAFMRSQKAIFALANLSGVPYPDALAVSSSISALTDAIQNVHRVPPVPKPCKIAPSTCLEPGCPNPPVGGKHWHCVDHSSKPRLILTNSVSVRVPIDGNFQTYVFTLPLVSLIVDLRIKIKEILNIESDEYYLVSSDIVRNENEQVNFAVVYFMNFRQPGGMPRRQRNTQRRKRGGPKKVKVTKAMIDKAVKKVERGKKRKTKRAGRVAQLQKQFDYFEANPEAKAAVGGTTIRGRGAYDFASLGAHYGDRKSVV